MRRVPRASVMSGVETFKEHRFVWLHPREVEPALPVRMRVVVDLADAVRVDKVYGDIVVLDTVRPSAATRGNRSAEAPNDRQTFTIANRPARSRSAVLGARTSAHEALTGVQFREALCTK